MAVKSTAVKGRRTLKFLSFDEVLADAEKMAANPNVKTLGNWPFDRLLTHLAMSFECSIDGFKAKAPWFVRLIVPFFKASALKNPMAPGITLPAEADQDAYPPAASVADALRRLQSAIARAKTERMVATHPAFGKMTHDEWVQLHLRHCELHLSFVVAG